MDEVRAFFNNPAPSKSQMIKLRGPVTGGVRISKHDNINELNRREEHRHSEFSGGTEYVQAVKEREMQMYMRNEAGRKFSCTNLSSLESMEQLSSWGASTLNIGELTEEAMTEVYNKYSFKTKEHNNNLSINDYKQLILDSINSLPVVIVEGPTGCGKTTQVPQWILESHYQARKPCKIVVTQPRRIAAISIAKRVAQERGWDVGGPVGYQVGLDSKVTSDTCIHYVTTGVLLQKLISTKTMNEYTHVILDEVHERDQEMDFLLLVVRRLLYTVSKHVRVVLMSATFNSQAFADYFMTPIPSGMQISKCIKVDKKQGIFGVKIFYLNELKQFGSILHACTPKSDANATIAPEMSQLVIKLLNAFEDIDKTEDNFSDVETAELPSVLIFLPGIHEIEDLYSSLTDLELRKKVAGAQCAAYNWWVLPLHSTITSAEQVRVFQRAPPGQRKIILATNIAESSITVPDIKYVIDYCLMKQLVADSETNFTALRLSWATKTNCEQRAGRAGRVRDGRVYRLVNQKFYDEFKIECEPEIRRCPLERLVVLAKMLDMGPPSDILALAMDPPDLENIHRTVLVLKELGALTKTIDDEWSSIDGELTFLGRISAKLPVDVRLSKLIMLGYIYGCLEETIIMAAAMSVKNLFNSPFRERLHAYNSKLTWADGSTSDCIAFCNVYKVWCHMRQQQQLKVAESAWARRFYVQARALRDLDELVRDLTRRLSGLGIDTRPSVWGPRELPLLYKIVISGAFYPQYFVQVSEDESRERDAVRTLSGLDPRNTVYLKNFPDNQPGELYASAIKRAVVKQIFDEPLVTFDKHSNKVYLTFKDGSTHKTNDSSGDPTIPGQVVLPVYKAVKARQLRIDIRIPVLPAEKANELMATLEMENLSLDIENVVPRLPEIDDTHFPLIISQWENVSLFWAQYADESTANELRMIERELQAGPALAGAGEPAPGALLAAPYALTGRVVYCRARVLALLPRNMLHILYIDYGSMGQVQVNNMRELPDGPCKTTPPLAMRCRLQGIAPSPLLDPHSNWTPEATKCFQNLVGRGRLLAKVYSVVHGVVSIELLAGNGKLNINQKLIKEGFAVSCEESYESKLNHDVRETAADLSLAQKRAHNREQKELAFYQLREVKPPSAKDCTSDVCLKGPYSPLETNIHNLMYASRHRKVQVEWNSVNSVLLDTQPQEKYARLMVAAEVGSNQEASVLTLRHTTMMPDIPGLPAIIALLFCPVAELRRNSSGSRYVSVLCGLGSTDSGRPYFPEHDLLVDIDADLDVKDISLINHIRHMMDFMIECNEGQDEPAADDQQRQSVSKLIHKELMELLLKHRAYREPEHVGAAWEWRSAGEHELLEISEPDMLRRAQLFPLHVPQGLRPLSDHDLRDLKLANDELKLLVARTPISSNLDMVCKLCNTKPMPLPTMRIHLYSNAHREKEEDLRMFAS